MGTQYTIGLLASLALSGAALAQAPQGAGSTVDQNRIPIYGGGIPSAGVQQPIASFPAPSAVGSVNQVQPYQPPRPGLSPYLNLNRGAFGGGGVSAIDYYNFVRPAQQSLGSFVGRQPGPFMPSPRNGGVVLEPDVQLDPDTQLRSAGSPASFMTTGRYFNSMGTIGMGARAQQRPAMIGRR